jgi:hypothetical protein
VVRPRQAVGSLDTRRSVRAVAAMLRHDVLLNSASQAVRLQRSMEVSTHLGTPLVRDRRHGSINHLK